MAMRPPRSHPPPPPGRDGGAHVTDHLANERTFLAWIRTSIALISLGFVVAKFSVWLRQFQATVALQQAQATGDAATVALLPRAGVSLPAGIALMAAGAALAIGALLRHDAVARGIARGEFRPARGLVVLLTAAVVLAAVAFIAYLAATAARG